MSRTFLVICACLLALALYLVVTAPDPGQLAAERTERARIEQTERTERARLDAEARLWMATENQATLRLVVIVAAALAGLVIVAGVAIVIADRALRRPSTPPPAILLLAARTGMLPEYDPQRGWLLIAPDNCHAYTPAAARRFLMDTHLLVNGEPPRQIDGEW